MVEQTDLFSVHQQLVKHQTHYQWKQWFRNFLYMPWRTRHYFDDYARQQITQAVTLAEQQHVGEIQIIIEGHLPLPMALKANTTLRAQQLFAQYGVWDTAYNSGVLLYVNICQRDVVILADRGINQFVAPDHWNSICQQITQKLSQSDYQHGVIEGIQLIGDTLGQFYRQKNDDRGNELQNHPIVL